MKKIVTLMVAAAATLGLASCGNNVSGNAKLTTPVDSAAYAVGISNGAMFKQQFEMSPEKLDVDKFLKGFNEGINADEAYASGLSMGQQFNKWISGFPGEKLDMKIVLAGLVNALKDSNMQMTPEDAQAYFQSYIEKANEAEVQDLVAKDDAFIEELKKDPAVQTTESGLMYKITEEGTGLKPTAEDTVVVHYKGYQVGKEDEPFDSSYDRNEPATFALNQVIAGWTEGMQLMPAGSKFTLYIPGDLGYGPHSVNASGRPQGLLIFECELLEVKPHTGADAEAVAE